MGLFVAFFWQNELGEYLARAVERQLEEFAKRNPGYTPDMANAFLQMHLIPALRTKCNDAWNTGGSLNDFFKTIAFKYVVP